VTIDQATKQAIAASLRDSAKIYQAEIARLISSQTNTDGSQMEKVTDDYAEQRKRTWSISNSVVFQASGQLLRAIKSGTYKLFYDKKRIDAIKSVFSRMK